MHEPPIPEFSDSTVALDVNAAKRGDAAGASTTVSMPRSAPPEQPDDPLPARIEQYEIVNRLGRGGMGEVFLAYDPVLKRRIALKRIRPERSSQQEARERFTVEARVTASLQHPSIVPVYSFSSAGEDVLYTMRPVEGMTLADIIDRLRRDDARAREEWSVPRLVRLFLQATGAVAFAHSRSVAHRDLKPSNIMIGPFEEVLVLDWGLAKVLDGTEESMRQPPDLAILTSMGMQTASQTIIGTPGYISSEQLIEGAPPSTLGDVFALGVILYELLALRSPWSAADLGSLIETMKRTPPDPTQLQPGRDIPALLAEVAIRAIHPNPEHRYASVTEFARDVADALEGRASWQSIDDVHAHATWRPHEGRVDRDGDVLTLQSRGRNQEFTYVYGRPVFTGDLRVEFDFSLRHGRHAMSVLINCADIRDRTSPTGYSLGVVSRKHSSLALLRNGRDVAGARSPEYPPRTWHHAIAERCGDRLSLQVDGELLYAYGDPIPLRGGFVALVGSATAIDVRNLKLWSRGASSTVSCLAVPDAFFNHRLYEQARSEYLRIASSLPGRREGRLAAFRAGLCYIEMARNEDEADVRDMELQEADLSFASLRANSRSCLAGLGSAIVARERGDLARMRSSLAEALAEYPDDPHLDAAREWLLAYLHGLDETCRRSLAECMPLALEYCLGSSGTRVVNDRLQVVRTTWEVPSFMAARLQGKLADAAFRAEAKLFFGFWSARAVVAGDAARALAAGDRLRPHHVSDSVFALLELEQLGEAELLLRIFDRVGSSLGDERFAVASGLARSAVFAQRGDLAGAEKLLAGLDCEATDRAYNTARLLVARAECDAGRQGTVFKILRGVDRHDSFAREHRAWFAIEMDDVPQAEKDLAPLVERGSHERGRNLTNFLHGLTLVRRGEEAGAMKVFTALAPARFPRTWTLGSHCASGLLAGERLAQYEREAFPWELKQLYAQMALLAAVRGDHALRDAFAAKSRAVFGAQKASSRPDARP